MSPVESAGTVADDHRRHAAHFTTLVNATTDWQVPTPVQEWQAHDIVDHLTSWLPGMLQKLGVDLPTVNATEPPQAWAELNTSVQALLDDPERSQQVVTGFDGAELPVSALLTQYYIPDVFMHSWDLAKATGQDDTLDPETVHGMLQGMTPIAEQLRASGQFGDPQLLDATHSEQDRLIALIGRDPGWQPPTA